jgi:P pilus assembly chaperone PapD
MAVLYTPKRLAQFQAAAADTTQYTVPGATSCIIKEIVFCNTTGGAISVWVSFVASGGTAGDSNRVINSEVIQPNSTTAFTFAQVLATGGFISCKAGSSASITTTISGVEFS